MTGITGYLRPDGKVGVRNQLLVLATVSCVNGVIQRISREVLEAVCVPHAFGCGRGGPRDLQILFRVLSGMIRHPNVGAAVLIGLGCEIAKLGGRSRVTLDLNARAERRQVGLEAVASPDFFGEWFAGAVFPMHAEAGARMYREFSAAFGARIPGLPIMVPEKLGDRFEYRGGRITRRRVVRHPTPPVRTRPAAAALAGAGVILAMSGAALVAQAAQATGQSPSASQDVFAFVRALDEAAARGVWPGFSPASIPLALFDGERTILLRHPSPPPEFSPMPGRPGVLVSKGRHPAVTGNSTRDIGGVRTATVIVTPGQPVTTNITVATGHGITISADNVTLDLNGFTVSSANPAGTGTGILFSGTRAHIPILNGHIRGNVTYIGGVYSGNGFGIGIGEWRPEKGGEYGRFEFDRSIEMKCKAK